MSATMVMLQPLQSQTYVKEILLLQTERNGVATQHPCQTSVVQVLNSICKDFKVPGLVLC